MATARVEIKNRLEELSKLRQKETRLQKQFDKAIKPHEVEYLKNIKPVQDIYEPKLLPVREQISKLENEITDQMLSTLQPDGSMKLTRIENEAFVVEANSTARREVEAKTFFEAVEDGKKSLEFWGCYAVLIGKAEKFLGSGIDAIANIKRSWSVKITKK